MPTPPDSAVPVLPPLDARIPRWVDARLQPRACPFCGEAGTPHRVRPDGLTVNACARCAAQFVSPAPDADALAALYADYYDQCYLRPAEQRDWLRELVALLPAADVRLRTLARLAPLRGARVLDVGCGVGTSLRQCARLGARVSGVEMDGAAVAMLRARHGFTEVHEGDFLGAPLAGPFDLLLLYDVIEHPLDPLTWLRRATDLLAPGGLLVLWTPNGAAREPDLPLRVDLEHLQYLAPATVRWLAPTLNLEIAHLATLGHPNLADRRPNLSPAARLLGKLLFATRAALTPHAGDYNLFAILRKSSV
jgi:2-polyprenyl-3-methyl-5-hydroxy-6-metoxy-1,4-benzoquinol methylase